MCVCVGGGGGRRGGGGERETIIIVVPNTTLAVITRMTLALRWAALQTSEWFINGRGVVDGVGVGGWGDGGRSQRQSP